MQVSQVNDHVTHAVIGGSQAIQFGISNSAEFFNILSSTLYKDQILAVVREVLCNAWDAHIEAGCTDKPVQITLTKDKFTIKDFGKGIHNDDMGIIYGTYGNSTKKNDGKQTGGFGLGCKAPFAYTDHFEVVSCHDGVKTIYNLSKSSAQAMGKPGIVPIASFPTEDTGLEVTINIKTPEESSRFKGLIRRIVHNGSMNMTLNGGVLDKLTCDFSVNNYFITNNNNLIEQQSKIMIRYGNVIYPVDPTNQILNLYNKITDHLYKLQKHNSFYIIFQAPPHSISVTPSRESLSMQEHTINTLNGLFKGFITMLDTKFSTECYKYSVEIIKEAVDEAKIDLLLYTSNKLPFIESKPPVSNINDLSLMAKQYINQHYINRKEYRKFDIKTRLDLMVKAGYLDRGIVQTYLKELKEGVPYQRVQWLKKRILAPLMVKLNEAKLDHKNLYVFDPNDQNVEDQWNRKANQEPMVQAYNSDMRDIYNGLPYLRNIVVLSTSKIKVWDAAINHPVFKEMGKYQGFLFYHLSRKAKIQNEEIAFFKASGMNVVDLTDRVDWDRTFVKKTYDTVKKPAKKGLVCLTSVLGPNHRSLRYAIDTTMSKADNAPLIENPKLVMTLPINKDASKFSISIWDYETSGLVVELFGTITGIAPTIVSCANYKVKGAKDFDTGVIELVSEYMTANTRIAEYWSVKQSYSDTGSILDIIYNNSELGSKFNLINPLTVEDKKYLKVWAYICEIYRYRNHEVVLKAKEHLSKIPVNPDYILLKDKLVTNPFIELIDTTVLSKLVKDPTKKDKIIEVVTSIINS